MKAMAYEVDGKHKETEDKMERTSRRKHEKDWLKERKCGRSMQVQKRCKKSCRNSGTPSATSSHWRLNWIKTGLMIMMMIVDRFHCVSNNNKAKDLFANKSLLLELGGENIFRERLHLRRKINSLINGQVFRGFPVFKADYVIWRIDWSKSFIDLPKV